MAIGAYTILKKPWSIGVHYQNEYGELTLEPVSDLLHVSKVLSDDPLVRENMFSFEDAEWIALITDNRGIQLSISRADNYQKGYVVIHESPSMVRIAKATILSRNLSIGKPGEEIERVARSSRRF